MRARHLVVIVPIVFAAAQAKASPLFVPLGDLPGGTFGSGASAVSGDGTTVVGTSAGASGNEAFVWRAGDGMQGLGDLPGGSFASGAADVSADGSVVVGTGQDAAGSAAFRWTQAGGLQPLGPGATTASAITRDGTTIVGGGGQYGYRWTEAGGVQTLTFGTTSDVWGDGNMAVSDVSDNGAIVVGYAGIGQCPGSPDAIACGWRWTSSTGFRHADIPGIGRVHATSASGRIVVGTGTVRASGLDFEAAAWFEVDGRGYVGVGALPDHFNSAALDVSANGQWVVGTSTNFEDTGAFLFHPDLGILDLQALLESYGLDLTGWTLTHATGISDDGRVIVGSGINPSGVSEAWLAIVPEPSTLSLLASGLLLIARRQPATRRTS